MMKQTKKTVFFAVLLSIALFALGLFTFDKFIYLVLPKADGVSYYVTDLDRELWTTLSFSLVIGLMPILVLATWVLAPIVRGNKKCASIMIVLISIVLAVFVRKQMLSSYFTGVPKNFSLSPDKIDIGYLINQTNFEYYMFLGGCMGCLISYFLLREKRIQQ